MKQSKYIYIAQLLVALIILISSLLFATTRKQTQAVGDPILTPSYLAFVIHEFTPTPTATNTPTPTATPVPPAVLSVETDTSVVQGLASNNFNNDFYIYTGYHKAGCGIPDSVQVNRGLLKFNIPNTPPGATVVEAKLNVHLVIVCWDQDGTRTVTAHRITEDWVNTTVNWNNQPSRSSTVAGSTSVSLIPNNVLFDWYTLDITGLVRNWANDTIPNYGLMLRSPESSGNDFAWIVFYSQDFDGDPKIPYLTITYSNGATAVTPLNHTIPNTDSTTHFSCGTMPGGMSFCGPDGTIPFTNE